MTSTCIHRVLTHAFHQVCTGIGYTRLMVVRHLGGQDVTLPNPWCTGLCYADST